MNAAPGMALLSAGYALALFHRTSGAVLAMALAAAFECDLPRVAAIATAFFWIYALLQLPSGLVADILGPRRLASAGCLVTAAGAILFGLAGSPAVAIAARCIIAVGCSVTFVTLMRYIKGNWPSGRVATVTGRAILIGNIGAISSAAPLALLLALMDWRLVSWVCAAASLLLASAIRRVVRDACEPHDPVKRLRSIVAELKAVFSNLYNYLGLLVLAGLSGAYYALIGLWAMPMLQARGIPAPIAAWGVSAAIAGYALGASFLGWLGDRKRQRGVTLIWSCCGALTLWGLLVSGWPDNGWMVPLLFALGFACGGFTLVYAIVTEYNPIAHAGTATAFINTGIFAGAAAMQGLATDALVRNGGSYEAAMIPMAGGALLALATAFALCSTRGVSGSAARTSTRPGSTGG